MFSRRDLGKRVDVGRIDLMPNYTLFDVPSQEARRVVDGLTGADWMGERLYSEIATDKDYQRSSSRRKASSGADAAEETTFDYFRKKSRAAAKPKQSAKSPKATRRTK